MNVKAPLGSRAFERVLRAPLQLPQLPRDFGDGQSARKFFYQTLARVSVRHTYYKASGGRCPDFTFRPTPASAAFMADLGLLFRVEDTGFSVLYDEKRREPLLRILRRQDNPLWTRLSFQLISKNDAFVSFTRIPITTDPAAKNFYFTNQRAHDLDDLLILNQGNFATKRELLPVAPGQVVVPARIEDQLWVEEARVLDIANNVVLCVPRCVTLQAAKEKNPASFTCADKGDAHCTDRIFLNFSSLPEGKYTLELIGLPIGEKQRSVLYTSFYPMPLGFVDLLFTSPDGEQTDHYPVRDLSSPQAAIVPVHYTLRFKRRKTIWNYYIVPPRPDRFTDLRIETEPATGFDGPTPVLLPDGRPAFLFVSQEPIPLQQRSKYRFRLKGRNLPSPHESVLVDRLPVASRQVLPNSDPLLGESNIYVYI